MNKNYFKYLFNSKRVLAIFIILSQVLIFGATLITTGTSSYYQTYNLVCISIAFVTILAFVLPMYLISFINNKKACDIYMSLPINRKQMIVTTLLFAYLLIALPEVLFGAVLMCLTRFAISSIFLAYVLLLIYGLVLLVFNTGIYLIGNNNIDSLIILAGYSVITLVVQLTVSSFASKMIYGIYTRYDTILDYAFLINVASSLIINHIDRFSPNLSNVQIISYVPFIICSIVYLLIGLYSIKRNFLEREIERAETISDKFFGYKFLIHFITACVIFMIIVSFPNEPQIRAIISSSIVWIVAVIVLYIVATFIYRRELRLRLFSIIYLVVVILASTIFTKVAYNKEGFGLSYRYDHNPKNMILTVNLGLNSSMYDDTIYDYTEYEYVYSSFELVANQNNPNKEKIVSKVNELRDTSIKKYFTEGSNYTHTMSINVITNYDESEEYYWLGKYDSGNYYNLDTDIELLKYFESLGADVTSHRDYYNEQTGTYETIDLTIEELVDYINKMEVK